MKHIALSSASTTYTPPSLEGKGISFTLREPTEDEMDRLSTELFKRGCVPIDQGRMRAVLIDEIYKLYPEAEADEKAGLLEQVWNADTAYNNAVALWTDQERERLLDVAHGAPEQPMAKHPEPGVSIRVQSQAQLVRDEMMEKSTRFRELTIQSVSYDALQKEWTMLLYVLGWTGLKTKVEKDETGQALTPECFDAMSKEIAALSRIAPRELYHHIAGSFSLSREEVGNSDLPASGDAGPTPSPTPSDDSESKNGSSTTSNIEPTRSGVLDLENSGSSTST